MEHILPAISASVSVIIICGVRDVVSGVRGCCLLGASVDCRVQGVDCEVRGVDCGVRDMTWRLRG